MTIPDISGYWTGEILGTNRGGVTLDIKQEGERVSGIAKIHEPALGGYEYTITGVIKEDGISLRLLPGRHTGGLQLGIVQAVCRLKEDGSIYGRWKSDIGTEGTFTAQKHETKKLASELPKKNSVNSVNYVEKFNTRIQRHKTVAALIIFGTIVIALGAFTDALDKISQFLDKHIGVQTPQVQNVSAKSMSEQQPTTVTSVPINAQISSIPIVASNVFAPPVEPSSLAQTTVSNQQTVTVHSGNTEKVFGGELFISLVGTSFEGTPLRDKVVASVSAPGFPSVSIDKQDVGYTTIYSAKAKFEIRITSASTFTADFLVTRLDPDKQKRVSP